MAPRDDEALGRTIRVFGPALLSFAKRYGPVAGIAYALGGGSGTLVARVNEQNVTMDSIRTALAPLRDTVATNRAAIRELDVRVTREEQTTAAHSAYLAGMYSPWTSPYRGP